jgi:eukaryotic-like serine/threonine-protein kinase
MGTVYLCEHAVLKRRFALKVLRPELAGDSELVERFRNEAIAASRIGQENVVDVVDFGTEPDGALYYVMEALDGRNLGVILRDEGALAVPRALALLEQVCRALAAAHAGGVVHRDVKPENVLVGVRDDGTEWAKVVDFGISHVPSGPGRERLTRAGAIIGTPEYMAPEQATGGAVDHRADVYAVGVLPYEMLTGTLPFEATSDVATLVAAQLNEAEPPSARNAAVPPEVDAVVLRAMAKRPGDRYTSMGELAAELQVLQAAIARANGLRAALTARTDPGPPRPKGVRGPTVSLDQRGPSPAPIRSPRARAAAAVALAAIACVGVAVFAGWWWRGEVGGRPPGASAVSPGVTARGEVVPAELPSPVARPTEIAPEQHAPGATPVRARVRRTAPPRGEVKDPYGDARDLKPDPFR